MIAARRVERWQVVDGRSESGQQPARNGAYRSGQLGERRAKTGSWERITRLRIYTDSLIGQLQEELNIGKVTGEA